MTSCNKPEFNMHEGLHNLMKMTCFLQLIDKLQQVGKNDNLQQACGAFFGV